MPASMPRVRRRPKSPASPLTVPPIIAAGPSTFGFATIMGFLAVTLASVNIFGGFVVTNRMLQMFKKKQ